MVLQGRLCDRGGPQGKGIRKEKEVERQKKMEEKLQDAGPGHSFPCFCLPSRRHPVSLSLFNPQQMTQGNVGSLLVFDPAKAGAAGTGGSVAPGDAVVGIVTERGEFFFSPVFFCPFY